MSALTRTQNEIKQILIQTYYTNKLVANQRRERDRERKAKQNRTKETRTGEEGKENTKWRQ